MHTITVSTEKCRSSFLFSIMHTTQTTHSYGCLCRRYTAAKGK